MKPERILSRKLARQLSTEELAEVFGGHVPTSPLETCSGNDCDEALKAPGLF